MDAFRSILFISVVTLAGMGSVFAAPTDTTWQALSTQIAQDHADLMVAIEEKATAEDLQALDAKFATNMQSSYSAFEAKANAVEASCKAQSGQARFELVTVGAALMLGSCVLEYYRRR